MIDLQELASRENEQVEWKDQVADVADVVRTLVAFANDFSNLGGGYVVCGASEGRDAYGFQKVTLTGLDAPRLREIEKKVLHSCQKYVDPALVPLTTVLPAESPRRRILVFIMPASPHAHLFRAGKGTVPGYFVRISSDTMEARNGTLRELLVRKKALAPWDRRANREAATSSIDLVTLRDTLQEMRLWDDRRPLEDYLSSSTRLSSFVPPLTERLPMVAKDCPRNFTLLLFGRQPTDFIAGAMVVFSIYRGTDRSEAVAERVNIEGTLVAQAKKLIDLLNTQNFEIFDKNSAQPNQTKYPRRALQEAVINALVHRDYESVQPVRVTVFADRIEINSPGALPRTIDPDHFRGGKAAPFWRNQTLAYFFNKLQLAQAEGQGIPTIIRTMKEGGCPAPEFQINPENLVCILPAHPRHRMLERNQRGDTP